LFVALFFNNASAQSSYSHSEQAYHLIEILNKYHYDPIQIDDYFYKQVFDDLIKQLDPYCLYFTKEDINILSTYNLFLVDYIRGQSDVFIDSVGNLYHQRLVRADTIMDKILQKPLDFSESDTIILSSEEIRDYASSLGSLVQRWNKYLKYQALLQLAPIVELVEYSMENESEILSSLDSDIRNRVRIREKRNLIRILDNREGFNEYVASQFLDAIAGLYDAHTNYFSPKTKLDFESLISKEAYSYGIDLEESQYGEVFVLRLDPGGAAWKSNKIHKGDILIQIELPGEQPIDISIQNLYEVRELLQLAPNDPIILTVKKKNGQIRAVTLVKEKSQVDENVIKSYILKGEKTIGYISLPSFYTDWSERNPDGCANDMAKEVIKLKKENVEGMIIDLRFNGGGSIFEALDLAGIFIDHGPLCIHSSREKIPMLLKDMNRGTIYEGPLVLLVNSMSASASEMLAAIMQDYNRALIVGSRTFGKATGQVILPLAPNFNLLTGDLSKVNSDLGFIKITIDKFYRLNGSSYQLNGVIPDIMLPESKGHPGFREEGNSYALSSDTVSKKVYFNPLPALPIDDLVIYCSEMTTLDSNFQNIELLNDFLAKCFEKELAIPLEPGPFIANHRIIAETLQNLESLSKISTSLYLMQNNRYDQDIIQWDQYSNEINEILLKDIEEDIYIRAAFQIINEFINLNNN
jgi:carboxyl-terminal processing protease